MASNASSSDISIKSKSKSKHKDKGKKLHEKFRDTTATHTTKSQMKERIKQQVHLNAVRNFQVNKTHCHLLYQKLMPNFAIQFSSDVSEPPPLVEATTPSEPTKSILKKLETVEEGGEDESGNGQEGGGKKGRKKRGKHNIAFKLDE